MSDMGSSFVWIAAVPFVGFCALMYFSAWLRGPFGFAATVAALVATFGVLAALALRTESGLALALSIGMYFLVAGGFFYVVGGRYLTQTEFGDLTYQSHSTLVRFLDENGITSPLAALLRVLGPGLFAALVLFVVVVAWAKLNGAIT